MKKIRFFVIGRRESVNDSGEVEMVNSLTEVEMPYSEESFAIMREQSHNGEYTIDNDGIAVMPTQEERLAALEAAMLEMMGVSMHG